MPLPKIEPIKKAVIKDWEVKPLRRPLVMASLGCHLKGACMPHPDPSDRNTMKAGVLKRFLMKPPEPDKEELSNFSAFVRDWIQTNLVPLSNTADTSVETWLSKTSYPAWRKDQLLMKYRRIIDRKDPKHFKVKSFMKDETYPEYKHARAINSRTDEFKALVGPTFKLIEKELFRLDWFIKKVPVKDRPRYIQKMMGHGRQYFASDYTAYESHFVREILAACEWELYDYMTKELPNYEEFMYYVKEVIGGKNECIFKFFQVDVEATRMSGEMNTSLGNGFANLMLMLYLCDSKGLTGVSGVVEGDDGLFTGDGTFPTAEDFKKLGFTIKCEVFDRLSDASFCGLVFAPEDEVIVTNPLEELVSVGWTGAQYAKSSSRRKMELLKCKGISLLYQYGGCPILNSLGKYILRVTRNYRAKMGQMNEWEREQFLEAKMHSTRVIRDVPDKTRLLVERLYKIPIETQIKIEQYLDGLDELQQLDIPSLELMIPPSWKHYWFFYVVSNKVEFPSTDITPAPPT